MEKFDKFDDVEFLLEGILVGLRARKEIEPLRNRISELEKTIVAFREECTKLREERDFEADLYKALKNDYDELNQQFDDEQEISSELKRSIKALTAERDKLREEIDFETKLYKILRNDYDEANQQLDEAQEESSELKRSIKALTAERDNLRGEKNSLEKRVKTLTNQRDELKSQLADADEKISVSDAKRRDAEGIAKFYRESYGELDAAYKIYSTLNEDTRFDLAGIFGAGETPAGFFSGAVQESHLNSFWDYVSRHPDEENLQRLFDFCFAALNRGFREAPYTRLNVAQGNDFDDEFMRRTSQSPQLGNVVRVVLQGYCYSSGNVIRKSVVELG